MRRCRKSSVAAAAAIELTFGAGTLSQVRLFGRKVALGTGTIIGIDFGCGRSGAQNPRPSYRRRCPLKRAAPHGIASRLGPELMPQPGSELAVGLAFLKQGEEFTGRDAFEHFGDAAEAGPGKAVRDVAGIEAVNEELEHFVAKVTRQFFFSAPPPDSLQVSVCV